MEGTQGQISIFDYYKDDERVAVYRSETVEKQDMAPIRLFDGFDELYAITFSYGLGFIEEIAPKFKEISIIFGSNAIVENDSNAQVVAAQVFATSDEAKELVKKYPTIVEMLRNETLELRVPKFNVIDHRKLYILKNNEGLTRVITGSANMSKRAWHPDGQLETYEYDDSSLRFEKAMDEFDAAWDMGEQLPYKALMLNNGKSKIENNPMISKIKNTKQAMVFENAPESLQYYVETRSNYEDLKKLTKQLLTNKKNGHAYIVPEKVTKMIKEKRNESRSSESGCVPELTFDLVEKCAYLNNGILDLSPPDEEVKNDISVFLEALNNFTSNDFVGNSNLAETHFKIANFVFASPFIAPLRHEVYLMGSKAYVNLPLFAVITSDTRDAGKSFMAGLMLKMMLGKEVEIKTQTEANEEKGKNNYADYLMSCMYSGKGIPCMLDEIDTNMLSRIKGLIKNDKLSLREEQAQFPALIMLGNDLNPDEKLQKRMVFFKVNGSLISTVNKTDYAIKGAKLIKSAGNAFYRKYLGLMLENVYDFIQNNIGDDTRIDLMDISSKTIISIIEECGSDVPYFINELTWYKDYQLEPVTDAKRELVEKYRTDKNIFTKNGNKITIEFGEGHDKEIKSLCERLPNEFRADTYITQQRHSLILQNALEFEKQTGIKIRRRRFG